MASLAFSYPGYVVGLPVIAGVSDGTAVAVNPEAMLTMAASDSAGGCDANLRTNIPFGQDLVTGTATRAWWMCVCVWACGCVWMCECA